MNLKDYCYNNNICRGTTSTESNLQSAVIKTIVQPLASDRPTTPHYNYKFINC
ncbi:hypothetical protein GLOIN_2v1783180 [Rhizophagus irregularis DAOM 181602=DAOM 197198]|uniref:Uncharacterized protein n=1 Tax=Rhizophagus irregularis (strain DAOM 181602 / DAOM 197198 / MUCL 43194) TaxID=747089 RepID=A0A2P4PFQ2_RHIID|nr:hypothetical protein GLOIN_2v1783180 [Rhizophagus irregularis DAOM 181602=DAOM 197198]POG64211.1 hypothetical protein GLOIN_2v1783180 [Rhizophagus irregularis DAOM 181602=DAOM 197198]|eukprot:XP_025171077.1 hypothetical protein GLOIN_2v1783180 [Rhizophagus irregularis DAOM 181602=DAOM 197198]